MVDRALVFDHWRQRLLLVAHVPSRLPKAYERGVDALEDMASALSETVSFAPQPLAGDPAPPGGAFLSSMTREAFVGGVGTAKAHILAGDIFQVVLSRRTTVPAPDGALPVYRRLRITNPAPYMFFLRMGDGLELAGSSPEPLVRVQGRTVSARPIAGPVVAERRRRRMRRLNATSWPTRRNAPSTPCWWTWPATTWGGSVRPAPSGRPSSWASSGSLR